MNSQIAQQMHNTPPKEKAAVAAKIGKTDSRYWLGRIEKPSPREGYVSPFYAVQIAFRGQRTRFPLETGVREAAAAKAQQIYLSLLSIGWDATLARFKPQSAKPIETATIGELLAVIQATSGLRPSTFSIYSQALRLIAAGIADIGNQPKCDEEGEAEKDKEGESVLMSRFDYRTGGRNAWVAKVDAQSLNLFTPEAIQRWKLAYLDKAGTAPDARRRATNSVNAHLRNARSLFAKNAIKHALTSLTLPSPLPFTGVQLEKRGQTRYISRIDAKELLKAAQTELGGTERFKIFCLGLFCGLRKREIDSLLWRQVDFTTGQIRIEPTEYFQPKSEDSIAVVDVDAELIALLRGWKAQAKEAKAKVEFVIVSDNPPRYHVSRTNYRCEKDFNALYAWLASKGVTARKKLHELRKELGAILATDQGIFAAQQMLRHADIRTTQQFYADKKKRISAGFGSLLTGGENAIPFPAPIAVSTKRTKVLPA